MTDEEQKAADEAKAAADKEAADKAAAEAAKPSFVTASDLERTMKPVADSLAALGNSLNALAAANATRNPAGVGEPISLDDVAKDLQEGSTKKLGAYIDGKVGEVRSKHIDPAKGAIVGALVSQAEEIAVNSLVIGTDGKATPKMPYYKRFEAEVKAIMANVAPEMQANPKAYYQAYEMVMGKHAMELIDEERQKAVRGARDSGPTNLPGDKGGRPGAGGGATGKLDATEILGQEQLDSLKGMGRSLEDHAKSMKFESVDAYLEFVAEQKGITVKK